MYTVLKIQVICWNVSVEIRSQSNIYDEAFLQNCYRLKAVTILALDPPVFSVVNFDFLAD